MFVIRLVDDVVVTQQWNPWTSLQFRTVSHGFDETLNRLRFAEVRMARKVAVLRVCSAAMLLLIEI